MPRSVRPSQPGHFASWKQRMWHELHARAANTIGNSRFDPTVEASWLRSFTKRIPCHGCRSHWRRLLVVHPPDVRSPWTYFRWTVCAHNAVNARLEKRLVPFAEACARHGVLDKELPA